MNRYSFGGVVPGRAKQNSFYKPFYSCPQPSNCVPPLASGLKKYVHEVKKITLHSLIAALVREQLLSAIHQEDTLTILLNDDKTILWVDNVQIASLERLIDVGDIYLKENQKEYLQPLTDPLQLLEIVSRSFASQYPPEQWKQFMEEIANHLMNAPLAYWYGQQWKKTIAQTIQVSGYKYLWEYVVAHHKNDSALFFEQWATRGHPYHPCSKTKLGFSIHETMHYSPEFHEDISIVMAALRKDCARLTSYDLGSDYNEWFSRTFPEPWREWVNSLQQRGLWKGDYFPVPLHPWQVENIIGRDFQDYIQAGALHVLEECVLPTQATLSFRTVQPVGDNFLPHIKLAVGIQATSAMRTISAAATENGPRISRLLTQILEHESYFGDRLAILPELYGLHVLSHDEREPQLAFLFRENPHKRLNKNEMAIVVAALFEPTPIGQAPLFGELMLMVGVKTREKVINYFHRYADLVLGAYLDLYLLYGIALEGHQQNTLAIFANGQPVRMLSRDFGGLRIHMPTLKEKGIALKVYPDSATISYDKTETRNKLLHTVFQMHLGEWTLSLAKYFQMDEALFWREIKAVVKERFEAVKTRMQPEVWQQERQAILSANWPCKNLLRMRLNNLSSKYIYTSLPNPLADV